MSLIQVQECTNLKLQIPFGCVHIMAIDGYSSFIVGYATLPSKNSVGIYDNVYRPIITTYGVFDTLRADQGLYLHLEKW